MAELVQDNWLLIVAALIVLLLVAWWVFAATRRTRVESAPGERGEAAPARRNQALIDAPPAVARDLPVPTPAGLAGIGEAVSAAAPSAPQSAPPSPSAPAPAEAEPAPEPAREPEASAPAPAPAPPAPADAPAATGEADDLLRIKGLGPKLAERLRALGVTSLAQIAAWDDGEIDRIDAQLGRFQGRIRRDDWREQARLLTAGDRAGYEARFGRL